MTCTILQKTQRGIEIHRDSDLRDIFPDRVFDDAPQADLDLRILEERQAVPSNGVFREFRASLIDFKSFFFLLNDKLLFLL